MAEPLGGIVLFDGVCNLCDATVHFILDRDPGGRFRFASLQSEAGARVLAERGMEPPRGDPESILLVQGERVWERSDAALRIARGLTAPWRFAWAFALLPRPLRDAVYRFIGRNRYRWFGRSDACRVPTPEIRARFL